MVPAVLRSYRLEFARRAEGWREDQHREYFRKKEAEEREKKREQGNEAAQDAMFDYVTAVLASETAIQSFTVKVDAYQAATVEALMENEEQLRRVSEELQILLDQAYVLPDGRRVFKTEDGIRVFDEHGVEVRDIDPDTIEDWRPHWEKYQNPFERKAGLVEEREKLFEFQKIADEADAEIANAKEEGIAQDRLDELEKRLADEAPDVVKHKLGMPVLDQDAEPAATPQQHTTFRPAGRLDMPTL